MIAVTTQVQQYGGKHEKIYRAEKSMLVGRIVFRYVANSGFSKGVLYCI